MDQHLPVLPHSNSSRQSNDTLFNEGYILNIKTDTNEGLASLGVTTTIDNGSEEAELCSAKHTSNSDVSSNNSPLAYTPLDTTPNLLIIRRREDFEIKGDELRDFRENPFTSNESSTRHSAALEDTMVAEEHGVRYNIQNAATNQAFAAPITEQLKNFTIPNSAVSFHDTRVLHDTSDASPTSLGDLCNAVDADDLVLVRSLLEGGHHVDALGPHGRTPLMCASFASPKHGCTPKSLDIVNILLSYKADVNAKDKDGMSVLHFVAKDGDDELAEILLHGGALVNIMNNEGLTPLDLALAEGHTRVLKVLESHDANRGVPR